MNEHLSTDFLVDYVHGELAPTDDAFAHAHLASCAVCRSDYDAEISLSEVLRGAAASEEREMPSSIKAVIWEQIRAAKPGPLAVLATWLRPAIAVPVAALLVIGGFFASPLAHRPNTPTIAAAYYFQTHANQASRTPLSERASAQLNDTHFVADGPFESGYPATGALDGGR